MKEFFAPLWIFIGGNFILLLFFLFFPAIGSVQTQLESDIAADAANYWGLSAAITSTRLIIVVLFEGLILFAAGRAFLKLRR